MKRIFSSFQNSVAPCVLAAFAISSMTAGFSQAATVRVTVTNLGSGTTPVTPVFAAFHDGTYDIAQVGSTATSGLQALSELGNNVPVGGEFGSAAGRVSDSIGGGPITPGSSSFRDFTIDTTGIANSWLSLASMVLPSSDYFFGTVSDAGDTAFGISLADLFANGTQTFTLNQVYDAGTELNDFLTSAPPIPTAAGLFVGGPFAGLPSSTPPLGAAQGGTVQEVAAPFTEFLNDGFLGGAAPAVGGLQFTLTAVPEPSSVALLGLAFGGAAMRRRRKSA